MSGFEFQANAGEVANALRDVEATGERGAALSRRALSSIGAALSNLKRAYEALEIADCELVDGRAEDEENLPLIAAHMDLIDLHTRLSVFYKGILNEE